MFLNIDLPRSTKTAVKDDSGHVLSYGDLVGTAREIETLNLQRAVVFCLCENSAGALAGYLSFENNGLVPLMLSASMDEDLRNNLEALYLPSYYWVPESEVQKIAGTVLFSAYDYVLLRTKHMPYPLNDQLSLLLTTSGSTGSPKLVRHKYGNLESNASNVAKVFSWTADEVGICYLPMNYTMGLNVINSHLVVGASILLIKASLTSPVFWDFITVNEGTNYCGVPFSYDIMHRIGFEKMDLPKLKTLAEGGGKLTDKMFTWIADYAAKNDKRFCATFGTSETSARMTFLEPTLALQKIGSIGKAIPGGELFLLDEVESDDGMVIGELAYRGPNVTMGYAQSKEDLLKGDEFCGEYHTGDIAKRDKEGFYYIVGRKGRFLKLFGIRISLDEVERILSMRFPNTEFACVGNDKQMNIFITDESLKNEIIPYISDKTKLHSSAFRVSVVEKIPRNENGKVAIAVLNNQLNA